MFAPNVSEQYGHGERDERDDRGLLEEQQAAKEHEHTGDRVALISGAHQHDCITAHPGQCSHHRQ